MLLLAYLINGQSVGVDLPSWSNDDLNGNAPFVYSDTVLDGYADISSIENWDRFGDNCVDFTIIRFNIQILVIAIVQPDFSQWNTLTLLQKQVACKYVVAPYVLRVPTIVTEAQDKENWMYLLEATKVDRVNCVNLMRLAVGEYIRTGLLTITQTQDFFVDVSAYILNYQDANVPDFKNWIFGLAPYVGVFESKGYYSAGLQQKLMDIYNSN